MGIEVVWVVESVYGFPFTTCVHKEVLYVVGYESRSGYLWRVEARGLDGTLIRSRTIKPPGGWGELISCIGYGDRVYVAGFSGAGRGRWYILSMDRDLEDLEVLDSVGGWAFTIGIYDGYLYIGGYEEDRGRYVRVERRPIDTMEVDKVFRMRLSGGDDRVFELGIDGRESLIWAGGIVDLDRGFIASMDLELNRIMVKHLDRRVYTLALGDGCIYIGCRGGIEAIDMDGEVINRYNLYESRKLVYQGGILYSAENILESARVQALTVYNERLERLDTISPYRQPSSYGVGRMVVGDRRIYTAGVSQEEEYKWVIECIEYR